MPPVPTTFASYHNTAELAIFRFGGAPDVYGAEETLTELAIEGLAAGTYFISFVGAIVLGTNAADINPTVNVVPYIDGHAIGVGPIVSVYFPSVAEHQDGLFLPTAIPWQHVTELSAGSHTITMKWRLSGTGTPDVSAFCNDSTLTLIRVHD